MTAITISSGATTVSTATTSSYRVEDTGILDVGPGGTVSGQITISADGVVNVNFFGTVLDTVIGSGGDEYVNLFGPASDTTIYHGGHQYVVGRASDTTVGSGGYQYVEFGGTASDTTVYSGGIAGT